MFRGCGSGTPTQRGPIAQPGSNTQQGQSTSQTNTANTPAPAPKPDNVLPESQKALDVTKDNVRAGKDVDTSIGIKAGEPAEADEAAHQKAKVERVQMLMDEQELAAKKAELKALKDEQEEIKRSLFESREKLRDWTALLTQLRILERSQDASGRASFKCTADNRAADITQLKEEISKVEARQRELPRLISKVSREVETKVKATRSFTKDGKTVKEDM
jgi:hypothetical protein